MSRVCSITGTGVMSGNMVSHSNIKTRRKFRPNLVNITFISELMNCNIRLKVTAHTLRTIDKNGGIDSYLLKTSSRKLTGEAIKLKRKLQKIVNIATA